MEKENRSIENNVSNLKDSEANLQRQVNTLMQQLTLKDSEIVRANGKIETLQAYSNTLEVEVKESRQKIEALGNEIHSGQTSTI